MPFSGVRISWLMLARKRILAEAALSAASPALPQVFALYLQCQLSDEHLADMRAVHADGLSDPHRVDDNQGQQQPAVARHGEHGPDIEWQQLGVRIEPVHAGKRSK